MTSRDGIKTGFDGFKWIGKWEIMRVFGQATRI
jgi:hypothetical protein